MSWVLIAAASIVSGALGAMGLGGGGILLLVLVWAGLPQMTAQGINLLMILPVGALGLYFHHRNGLTDGRTAFPILLIRRAKPAGGAKRRCCAPNSALQRANAAVRA